MRQATRKNTTHSTHTYLPLQPGLFPLLLLAAQERCGYVLLLPLYLLAGGAQTDGLGGLVVAVLCLLLSGLFGSTRGYQSKKMVRSIKSNNMCAQPVCHILHIRR